MAGLATAIAGALLFSSLPAFAAVCDGLSARSANVLDFGTDYLPRVDFCQAEPGQANCALPLPASLPGVIEFPLYADNLQGAILGARFRLLSSQQITGFTPAAGLSVIGGAEPAVSAGVWHLDVQLGGASLCGPAVLGRLTVGVPAGCTGLWVDLAGHLGEPAPIVVSIVKGEVPAVSPRHGAYAGQYDPYHCQTPLCREPNSPVAGFAPLQSGGFTIELGWTAGGGDFTMIRYRTDGVSPTSIFDGQLLTLMPTIAGQSYSFFHENPDVTQYWYTAFAVTMSGDTVATGSRLECDSFTTATVDPSVRTEPVTWGAVKNLYH